MNPTIDNIMALADSFAEQYADFVYAHRPATPALDARDALRRTIEQALAPGEPVAWLESPYGSIRMNPNMRMDFPPQSLKWRIPLYTTPQPKREWVGLTDEDVRELDTSEFWDDHTPADFVRLVENKLREKNGGGV